MSLRSAACLAWVLSACTGGRTECQDSVTVALDDVARRWPDARAALDEGYSEDCVWYWAHQRKSVDGFGVTLALLEGKPSIDDVANGLDRDVDASGRLRQPTLLFFDQTDGKPSEWPLIGAGWHQHFTPCEAPSFGCIDPTEVMIHEAGYHHSVVGDGGMTAATSDDLRDGGRVDPQGCNDIHDDDLVKKANRIRHGRKWVVHAWRSPDGGAAQVMNEDPWERWKDAPNRVQVDPGLFFWQERASCGCPDTGG